MLISDNAQTFKKTSEWFNTLYKSREVKKFLQEKGIKWRFDLVRTPWWSRLFERLSWKYEEGAEESTQE